MESIDKQLKKGMALKTVDLLDEAYGALDALGPLRAAAEARRWSDAMERGAART